jgi:hypothetical protein|tara:strand:+ start:166 stop:381 length:216 start_codon:yes stop_codon:yes gene_type:complete
MTIDYIETKQERREKKRLKKKAQIKQHSKNLATIYKKAILKRRTRTTPSWAKDRKRREEGRGYKNLTFFNQ